MTKIIATVLNITVQDIESCRLFYKEILNFIEVIEMKDENNHEILFHNPSLSNNLLIRISENNKTHFVKPSADHLIIFYLNDAIKFQGLIEKLTEAGIKEVESLNPYWDKVAKTFLAPGDYRIVIHPGSYQGYKARIARPTSNMPSITHLYTNQLNFVQIGQFEDHEGFDGVMFASKDQDCHFEMTYQHGHVESDNPSGYSIELITEPDDSEVKILTDTDNYDILINTQKTFLNKYFSLITSCENIYQLPFLVMKTPNSDSEKTDKKFKMKT
ncbi:MAG: VOC family protein [Gammaproteobacteria bacterium]